MIYGYIRVSTEEQNLENQKKAISEKYEINEWVEEKVSGTIDYTKRSLGELITKLQNGDTLIVTELSRLGRSISMIFDIISELKKRKVRVIAIKNNFDMNPNNSNDIITSVIIFAFGLSAQIERQLISERTKQGLAVARAKGKRIGRQKGETVYYVKLRKYEADIMSKADKGQSINSLAREYNVQWGTMKNFIIRFSKMKKPRPLRVRPKKHRHPTYRELEYFRINNY